MRIAFFFRKKALTSGTVLIIINSLKAEAPASHPPTSVSGRVLLGVFTWALCVHFFYWRCCPIATQDLPINEEIRDPEVRLIDETGAQLGILDIRAAQRLADERELDLVKVSNGVPPTCKLMDYNKHLYDMMKREKENKKNQKVIEIKEIRLSATIDQHDMEVKAKACTRFLEDGNKVKVSIRFRGRQITRGDIGEDVMETFFNMVSEKAVKEKAPKQEGRNMFMVLAQKN